MTIHKSIFIRILFNPTSSAISMGDNIHTMAYEQVPTNASIADRDSEDGGLIPLLKDQAFEGDEKVQTSASQKALRSLMIPKVLLIHGLIALLYFALITTILLAISKSRTDAFDLAPYSPAQNAIEYEIRTFDAKYQGNPFAGDPHPEHDKAWSDILENIHIRVNEDELRELNRTSLALKDGGFLLQLGAYHELHCVKWIRKWIHRDHYWPALSGGMLLERKVHIDHCLEMFRFNAMCRGSQAVTTFEWFGS
ncbi:MAG: oxidase ustYa family protein, partial [Janthinobacterium lividum]